MQRRELSRLNPRKEWSHLAKTAVLAMVALAALMGNERCNWCDTPEQRAKARARQLAKEEYATRYFFEPHAKAVNLDQMYQVGDTMEIHLWNENGPPGETVMRWRPDNRVDRSTIQFLGQQPINPHASSGPYIFQNVPYGGESDAHVRITLTVPDPGPVLDRAWGISVLFDILEVDAGPDSPVMSSSTHLETPFCRHRKARTIRPGSFKAASVAALSAPAQLADDWVEEDYPLWRVSLSIGNEEVAMTTGACELWLELLQSEDLFAAVRYPVVETMLRGSSNSVAMPVVYQEGLMPTVTVIDPSGLTQPEMPTLGLASAPEHLPIVHALLPSAEDESWLALRVAGDSTEACPAGLDMPWWELSIELFLDLGPSHEATAERDVSVFFCVRGQDLPERMLHGKSVRQGFDTTCVGPVAIRLESADTPDPPMRLSHSALVVAEPGDRVAVYEALENLGELPLEVDLELVSEQGWSWGLYENGPTGEPDLTRPITPPVQPPVGWGWIDLWMVAEVPAEARGLETLRLVASLTDDAEHRVSTTFAVWVGGWRSPPSGGPLPEPRKPTGRADP